MILRSLSLQNFRSYTKKTFTFSPSVTLIHGKNASGKTNILEAIALLATGRSFRADQDREVVRWGEELSVVHGELIAHEEKQKLELFITRGEVNGQKAPLKKYLVNGVPRRMIDFIGHIRIVLFWPEHLELVTDSPSVRRKYLDSVLVQVDWEYRRNLRSYEAGLRQRNKLLDVLNEGNGDRKQLFFWNQLLIKAGGYLTDKRAAFIEYVNSQQLPVSSYRLEYDQSVISESRLEQYKDEEIQAKATLVGPHRDDFMVKLKTSTFVQTSTDQQHSKFKTVKKDDLYIDLSKYGSRGEQRLAVLWLKLAELLYIEKTTGAKPVLLLDDIFSEFDEPHKQLVFDVIGKQQTILTSADETTLPSLFIDTATVIAV